MDYNGSKCDSEKMQENERMRENILRSVMHEMYVEFGIMFF